MWKSFKTSAWLSAVISLSTFCSCWNACAQTYPVRPIRMLVGFAPGGGTDAIARVVAQKMADELRQPVVVENRPGADSAIANERVAKSMADGYTLLMLTSSSTIHPSLRKEIPYKVEHDLAPVSLVVVGPYVLVVNPSLAARNVKELIALAQSQPGKLNSGFTGVGSTTHLAGELFNLMAKVNIVRVPYKGGAEGAVATAADQVQMTYASITAVLPLIDSGRLRALAVTSAKRAALMPQVPTIAESGLSDYDRSTWYGVVVPTGVPREIISRLNKIIGETSNTAEVKSMFDKLGFYAQPGTPEQFSALIKRELTENAKLVKAIGLKPE